MLKNEGSKFDPFSHPLIQWDNITLSKEVLDKFLFIKEICPEAILAGGALRDSVFNVQIKDIDIFVGPNFTQRYKLITGMMCTLEHEPKQFDEYLKKFGNNVIKSVFSAKAENNDIKDLPIQIIVCEFEPYIAPLLMGFDWGFCQIGTTDGETFYVTPAFKVDVLNNTATYMMSPDGDGQRRSLQRASRLLDKYPARKFMVPLTVTQINVLTQDYDRMVSVDGNLNFTLA